jgi:sugar phosphate isomerase/epimerase
MRNYKFLLSCACTAPLTAPILLRGDILDNLKTAAALGYQGLELHVRETEIFDYEKIRALCAEQNVSVAAIATGRLNTQGGADLMDDRTHVTEAAMRGMRDYIAMAGELNADLILGWVKGRLPEGAPPEPHLERFAGNLRKICKDAEAEGVKIFLEAINRYETNFLNTAQEMMDFLRDFAVQNCFVHLDTFHMGLEETNPTEAIRLCGERLGYFHVADNTRMWPGSGVFDFQSYFRALDSIDYGGYISVECLPKPDGITAATKALEHLKGSASAVSRV